MLRAALGRTIRGVLSPVLTPRENPTCLARRGSARPVEDTEISGMRPPSIRVIHHFWKRAWGTLNVPPAAARPGRCRGCILPPPSIVHGVRKPHRSPPYTLTPDH